MGGSAFSPEGLDTPRMPDEVYHIVKQHVHSVLRESFAHVATPIEAPSKEDHGDIDVLVAEPFNGVSAKNTTPNDIGKLLGTKYCKTTPGSNTYHLAIPWPEPTPHDKSSTPHTKEEEQENTLTTHLAKVTIDSPKHIQVDIHCCELVWNLKWLLFLHAHGGLWNIVGGIIRPYGLTCSDTGFYLRIAEVEHHKRNLARVLMTVDPSGVLAFVGLDENQFWSPFESWNDLMDYAATGRFYDPSRAKGKDVDEMKKELKHNDRARAQKRPMFSYWFDEYMPAHSSDPRGASAHMAREEVVDEAKRVFGEDFANMFEQRKKDGIRTIGLEHLWSGIRKEIGVEGAELTYAMKGLKREIVEDAVGKTTDEMTEVQKAYVESKFDEVAAWAKTHWQEVGQRQQAFNKAKSAANYREKKVREEMLAVAGQKI